MAGYTRNDTPNNIADGNIINASDLDGEFDAIQSAFNGSTGHTHDGTLGNGPQIANSGIANLAVTDAKIANNTITGSKINTGTSITAAGFTGPLTGNASTASKLQTARSISLNGDVSGSVSFDGSANVSMTTTVANDSHTHSLYLPYTGGTMSGGITMFEDQVINGLSGSIATYPAITFNSSEGTHAAKTQTLAGDTLGQLTFNGYTGSAYTGGSKIEFRATEPQTSTQRGTDAYIYAIKAGQAVAGYIRFDGDNAYVTDNAGNTTSIWHGGNDGSGSGLDADLLDGQHGAYYLPASSYTAADVLAKLLTVDGSGSGLDADSLDGNDGSYYLNWVNTTNKPDPTITLAGDASGAVTLTDLTSGTLTVTVLDDSHNHIIGNVDGLQTALDSKINTTTSFGGDVTGTYSNLQVVNDSHTHDTQYYPKATADSTFLKLTGGIVTGAVRHGDNVNTYWGDSFDLRIYHDSTNSYIRDQGTGSLFIDATNLFVRNAENSESFISALANGAVNLYYDNSLKFSTASTGVSVTGNIAASGSVTSNGSLLATQDDVIALAIALG